MSESRYYVPRPHVIPAGVAATVGTAVVAGLLVGVLIGVVDYFDPVRLIAFAAVVAGGSLLGGLIGRVARATRLHHPGLRSVIGLAAGLVAAYGLWVACSLIHLRRLEPEHGPSLVDVLTGPSYVLQGMSLLSEPRYLRWSLGGFPSGVARHVFYVLEVALLVYCVWVTARERQVPFCHADGDWADELADVALLALPENDADLRLSLERSRYEVLTALRRGDIDEADCLRVTLFVGSAVSDTAVRENYLTIRHVNEAERRTTDVVRLLRVPHDVVEVLTAPASDLSERTAVPDVSVEPSPTDSRVAPVG